MTGREGGPPGDAEGDVVAPGRSRASPPTGGLLNGIEALVAGGSSGLGSGAPWPLSAPPEEWDPSAAPPVPLEEGLTVATAIEEARGDYESVKQVTSVNQQAIEITYQTRGSGGPGGGEGVVARRTVLRADLERGTTYRMIFGATDAEMYPGSTALGTSRAVLEDLRKAGVAELGIVAGQDLLGTVAAAFGAGDLFPLEGRLIRVDEAASAVPVLLNGSRVWLPALHAQGTLSGLVDSLHAQFWFLDDPQNPLALRAAVGGTRLQVVRIDFPVPSTATALERALESSERPVELFGVYFEFDSAEILPPSAAVIAEVVEVMRRHPDWRFRIEGHTDDVGGHEHNLDLSRRRAAAVADALIERLDGAEERLVAVGYGETRPREPNDTLEGRARNRRVELIRF